MSHAAGESTLLERATLIADRVLFPAAQDVDRASRVPASHLDALATAGLFHLTGSAAEVRRTMAAIASGCGATFFVWAQHHGVVRTLQSSSNADLVDRWLEPLQAGTSVAGVAFAHLRRHGTPAIQAVETASGWEITGVAPWATSWGVAERFAVAAVTDDGRVVWAMLPGVPSAPSFTVASLDLPVLRATGTVALHFDRHRVNEADVIAIDQLDRWQAADRSRSAQGQTGVLGVADRSIRELATIGERDRVARDAAERLHGRLLEQWRIDDLFSETPPSTDAEVAEASLHRAGCLRLGRSATTALLAAVGGRGMDLSHPAQRLAREAAFYVIQAQTVDGRDAALRSAT